MQTFQMAILLLFENQDTHKYSDIHEILQLSNDQFQKHINSLVECKLLTIDGDVSDFGNNILYWQFFNFIKQCNITFRTFH